MSDQKTSRPDPAVKTGNISPPEGRPYLSLVKFVEDLFDVHGDSHRGLGYPKPDGFQARYSVLLDVMKLRSPTHSPLSVLDLGCATGCLLDEIKSSGRAGICYRGVDLSPAMIEAARAKHPEADFVVGDPFDLQHIWRDAPDYVILGGLFQCRLQMSEEAMTDYMVRMLRLAFDHCRHGIAFNVMSSHVDWQREDLFHVPFDRMADILQMHLNRNYVFRADYGLYEYAVYVYK
ncbi:MAG TPA: class I SAM-dependent methyltransferase [Chthoniobacterales bacterium]|nr:class I SAM-dependent methyltransferase [Chthoniobacterales bacterium]